MNVEINLLPKKPKKNYALVVSLASLLLAVAVLLVLGTFYYQSIQRDLARVESEIETVRQLQEINSGQEIVTNEAAILDETIQWLEMDSVSSSFVLEAFTSQLPERGFFLNYDYSTGGSVSLRIQFDTQREAASYLHHLNQMNMVENAVLRDLRLEETVIQVEDEDEEDEEETVRRYTANYTIQLDFSQVDRDEEEV
ncbi:hypothetical protein QA612_05085 [Evansella sp. AB-P1]|uniref:hypothetical protein n=1 Tax=Evansella sp. AB-P1 TaxID=3037653 RepID=UPI00241CBC1C|nr:hypothetical protein [Evansella sp. AB-P1]MDG5786858.1 hypothetical protein [Evansella sp. AB-P1]